MTSPDSARAFAGPVPELYEKYMVPLIFEPYAADLARRVALRQPSRVVALCQGTPLRAEIEARGSATLDEATDVASEALAKRFGSDSVDGKIQAHVVAIERKASSG